MKSRILSTLLLWFLLVSILYFGGPTGGVLLLAGVCALGQYEFFRMMSGGKLPVGLLVGAIILGSLLLAGSYLLEGWKTMTFGLLAAVYAVARFSPSSRRQGMALLFASLMLPALMQFLVQLMLAFDSLAVPVWVIAVAKFNDVGGLLGGKWIGKTKLAPAISPGKTIEGAIFGVATGVVCGVVLWHLMDLSQLGLQLLPMLLCGLIIGPVSVVSDLAESVLKRRAGVKDSGSCIPGIGGVLDLIDSIVLTAPVAYMLIPLMHSF